MGYSHWNAAVSLTDPIQQLDKFSEPNRSEPTQRGDPPWFQLDGSTRITSLLRYSPGHVGAENVHGPVPGSPEHFSNSVWEPRRMFSQVAMRRPPEPPDLSGGRDPAATAAAACNHIEPQLTGIRITTTKMQMSLKLIVWIINE